MKIWKQDFSAIPGMSIARFPEGATLLSAREQNDKIAIWALCDPDAPSATFKIEIVETGQHVNKADDFLGTAMFNGGAYVLHVFAVDD